MKRTLRALFGAVMGALVALAIWDQLVRDPAYRNWHGDVFGIPYDFRIPSIERVIERWWAPDDPRVLTPHVFGVGWSINLGRIVAMGRSSFGR